MHILENNGSNSYSYIYILNLTLTAHFDSKHHWRLKATFSHFFPNQHNLTV